jgi:hypothetical protein
MWSTQNENRGKNVRMHVKRQVYSDAACYLCLSLRVYDIEDVEEGPSLALLKRWHYWKDVDENSNVI